MTNERVGSFVSDLVEMAKAVEQVPVLERELHNAGSVINSLQQTRSDLEVSLEASRRYAATLEQRCHDLEVQRDSAELRFLESDDAVGTLKRAMRIAMDEVDSALQAVTPVVPEPKADEWAELMANPLSEPSDFPLVDGPLVPLDDDRMSPNYGGTEVNDGSMPQGEEASADATSDPTTSATSPTDGVSVPSDPHSSTASSSPTPTSPSAPPVEPSTGAASDSNHGPYSGKLYINVPGYVSRADWIAGGGSEGDYDYRGGVRSPDGPY